MTIPEIPQGETLETILGTSPGIDITVKGVTAQGEVEDMMNGEVMPAMGADVERVARSPKVMGGLLQAIPWLGSPQWKNLI